MFYPVRPGNRGGRDLFKWDDVRYMKYNVNSTSITILKG